MHRLRSARSKSPLLPAWSFGLLSPFASDKQSRAAPVSHTLCDLNAPGGGRGDFQVVHASLTLPLLPRSQQQHS